MSTFPVNDFCHHCGRGSVGPENTLAARLSYLRNKLGMSLRAVEAAARLFGVEVSNAAISQIETGHTVSPSFQTVAVLAKIYDVPLSDLADGLRDRLIESSAPSNDGEG